jgi:5-methyltetrahydrofolate--homocysteine methyltransferase
MKKTLLETLQERRLVCDGAMGTQLMLAGLASGDCGELWNLKHPDRVLEIHKRYAAAGADCLITNTFGANRIALARHGAVGDTVAINAAGVRIAREAFGGRAGFVLGDIGPLGAMLEPYGDLAQADAQNAFTEQANALIKAGVDAIIIETQTSLDELGLAIAAARAVGAPCIIGSLAYDLSATGSFYATAMGVKPEKASAFLEQSGADIAALNCGTGMDMAGAAKDCRKFIGQHCKLPVMVQPNAGKPVLENGRAVYKQSPADMGGWRGGGACGRRQHHRFLLRQHPGTHPGDPSGRRSLQSKFMKSLYLVVICILFGAMGCSIVSRDAFNVRKFGAVGDGT